MKKFISILFAVVLVVSLCLVPAVASAITYDSTLTLENKDPSTWAIISGDGISGTLHYNSSGAKFEYSFSATGLDATTEYSLIYYADKPDRFVDWGGDNPGALIAPFTTDGTGAIAATAGSVELDMNLPCPPDANISEYDYTDEYGTAHGAKIWLVPSDCYAKPEVTTWAPTRFLFEKDLITYDDTGVTSWTVMVYLDADNDLEPYGIDNLNQMEVVGSTGEVNIIVLFDGDDDGDSVIYEVVKQDPPTNAIVSSVIDDEGAVIDPETGEVNMGAPETLTDFIVWTVGEYPADRYALVLWDHGAGWRLPGQEEMIPLKGVCWDYTDNDHLTVQDVAVALSGATAAIGKSLELLGFDACLMEMIEVAYEICGYADVMVGSEAVEPAPGWPYDTILADLVADPILTDAGVLAEVIVDRYGEAQPQYTMSALDLSEVTGESLAEAVVDLADWFLTDTNYDLYADEIEAAWADSIKFTYGGIDLGDFASNIIAADFDETANTLAGNILSEIEDTVIANDSGEGIYEGAQGIAIYMPEAGSSYPLDYDALAFAADFDGWDEFLKERAVGPPLPPWVAYSEENKTLVIAFGEEIAGIEISSHVGPLGEVPEEISLHRLIDVEILPEGKVYSGIVLMFICEEQLAEMGITEEQLIGISSWGSDWNLYPYSGMLPIDFFLSPPEFLSEKELPEVLDIPGFPKTIPAIELKGEIAELLLKSVPKVKGVLEKNPDGWAAVAWAVPWHWCPPPEGGVTNERITTMALTDTYLVDYPLPSPYMTWLQQGENLISLPLHPLNSDIGVVLDGMMSPSITDKVKEGYGVWEYRDGEWFGYCPGEPGVGELEEMKDGPGYWICMGEPTLFSILGSNFRTGAYAPPTYEVADGWNLVGVKAFLPIYPKHYLDTIAGKYSRLYGYNIFNDEYYTPEVLKPFEGYWLYMGEDGNIFGWNDDDLLTNFYPYLEVGPDGYGPWAWWMCPVMEPSGEYLGLQHALMFERYLFAYAWTYTLGGVSETDWMNLWSEGFWRYSGTQWDCKTDQSDWQNIWSYCISGIHCYYGYSYIYWECPFFHGWFPFDEPKTVDVVWPGTGITTETVPPWADAFTHLYIWW